MLKETLRQATINGIMHLDLLKLDSYARSNHEVLCLLYDHGVIDDSGLEEALHAAVITQAQKDYMLVLKTRNSPSRYYPDHVNRPDCFAYAISTGAFTQDHLRKISFDHGETPETYCQTYGDDNLLARLKEKLLQREQVECDTWVSE